ncbi:MAG TPA: hypothetical protein VMZ30_12585 [Pyrinomonadaceae bacterium]|nr:hypothetical protein [Pyrinomonadaceae bacterium]
MPDQPLACESIIYRAALEETWFSSDPPEVDAAAFYRRKGMDNDGISIGVSPYSYRSYLKNPIFGIISVHVGHVRDVNDPELLTALDIDIDDAPHGNIINVPFKERKGPRRRLAERIASLLARQAARVYEVFDPPHN